MAASPIAMRWDTNDINMPAEYRPYNTIYQGVMEVIGQKYWDTQTYTDNSTTALTGWFNTSRTSNAAQDVTNLPGPPGILSSPNAYLIRAIRIFFKQRPLAASPGASAGTNPGAYNNVAGLINTGVWSFTIGSKVYNQEPLWGLTAGGGAFGAMAAVGGTGQNSYYDYAQSGIPDPRAVNTLSKPLFIPPMLGFSGAIVWPAAIDLTGNIDITICLDGDLIRPAQ